MQEAELRARLREVEGELDSLTAYYREHPLKEDVRGDGDRLSADAEELRSELEQMKESDECR